LELGLVKSQEDEVVKMLKMILENGPQYLKNSGEFINGEELFYTEENAKLVKDAEEYYRKSFSGGVVTWNLRDRHMKNTLIDLMEHYRKKGISNPKAVIWAHNSHLGDCRATQLSKKRELNLGQLVREHFGLENTFNLGFSTHDGTVTAAESWGGEALTMKLNPSLGHSYENLFHHVSSQLREERASETGDFILFLRANPPNPKELSYQESEDKKEEVGCLVDSEVVSFLKKPRIQRAVGVQYVKHSEFLSHYFEVCLPNQFDSLIHIDRSSALH